MAIGPWLMRGAMIPNSPVDTEKITKEQWQAQPIKATSEQRHQARVEGLGTELLHSITRSLG